MFFVAFFVPDGKLVCHLVCQLVLLLVVRNYSLLRTPRRHARAGPRRLASLSQLQTALDEAAPKGFANGAFEELEKDVPAVVEEFTRQPPQPPQTRRIPLRHRPAEKVAQASTHYSEADSE